MKAAGVDFILSKTPLTPVTIQVDESKGILYIDNTANYWFVYSMMCMCTSCIIVISNTYFLYYLMSLS